MNNYYYNDIFINIPEGEESYYHIYFNNDKNEAKTNYFSKDISKIKIIINSNNKSLTKLFYNCSGIEKINFIKFNRKDINNMSYMFYQCYSLKELNFNNIYTNNVTNMSYMFYHCYSLK